MKRISRQLETQNEKTAIQELAPFVMPGTTGVLDPRLVSRADRRWINCLCVPLRAPTKRRELGFPDEYRKIAMQSRRPDVRRVGVTSRMHRHIRTRVARGRGRPDWARWLAGPAVRSGPATARIKEDSGAGATLGPERRPTRQLGRPPATACRHRCENVTFAPLRMGEEAAV